MIEQGTDDYRATLTLRALFGMTVVGILVAGYLTWSHFTDDTVLCVEGGGCDLVRQSTYSEVSGVPVALIGLVGYLSILTMLLAEQFQWPLSEHSPVLVFGCSLIGTVYSAYLTYLELFVIYAVCPYCIASAIIMLCIFVLAIYRLGMQLQVRSDTLMER